MDIFLPISIDLGARYTGCFFAGSENPADGARGIVLEANSDALTLQQTERRQMRHLRRNYKRRKLAKRLVELWLADRWPASVDSGERAAAEKFLRGLMNRRGFTHFSLDETINLDILEAGREGLECLDLVQPGVSMQDWIAHQLSDPEQARMLLEQPVYKLRDVSVSKKKNREASSELTDFIREKGPDLEKKEIKATVSAINHARDLLAEAAQAGLTGHKHRKEYLAAICADINNTKEGQLVLRLLDLDARSLANLLGHISNLNLPGLRGYFHDKDRETIRTLDVAKFRNAWLAFFRRWTLVGESGARQTQFRSNRQKWLAHLAELKSETNPSELHKKLWSLLTKEDPATSIPPFEAQTNRRPPKCQSLLLTPHTLNRYIQGKDKEEDKEAVWRAWSQSLQCANHSLADGLDRIAEADA